jgi:hypothetical protein
MRILNIDTGSSIMISRTLRLSWIAITLLALALLGCGSTGSNDGPDMDEMAARLNPPKPAPAPEQPATPAAQPAPSRPGPQTSATALPGGIVTSADPDDLAGRAASQRAAPPNSAPAAAPVHVPAVSRGEGDVVGKRVYANPAGGVMRYYGAIASARNFMEDRILDAQIQKTLQLYVAGNDGKFPKTNDEYMEHIIKEGMIQLPELPPGKEYFYDPSDHELKVGTLVDPPADAQPPAPAAAPPATR